MFCFLVCGAKVVNVLETAKETGSFLLIVIDGEAFFGYLCSITYTPIIIYTRMTIGGITGQYFAGSPIIVTLGEFGFPANATFKQVVLEVTTTFQSNTAMYPFTAEVGSEASLSFDISSALRAAMSKYDFASEVAAANAAIGGTQGTVQRSAASFTLSAYTKYMLDGILYTGSTITNNGGTAVLGEWDELERYLGNTQPLGGSPVVATAKPTADVERVGADSVITTLVNDTGTTEMKFRNASAESAAAFTRQGRTVLRDSEQEYVDFIFVNKRGAVEAVSALTRESLTYKVKTTEKTLVTGPTFVPSRSTTAYAEPTRGTFKLSSGWQTREWLAWWATDFLRARRWWMRIGGRFLPVTVKPDKESVEIYDRAKQEIHSVDFTATLALEGRI